MNNTTNTNNTEAVKAAIIAANLEAAEERREEFARINEAHKRPYDAARWAETSNGYFGPFDYKRADCLFTAIREMVADPGKPQSVALFTAILAGAVLGSEGLECKVEGLSWDAPALATATLDDWLAVYAAPLLPEGHQGAYPDAPPVPPTEKQGEMSAHLSSAAEGIWGEHNEDEYKDRVRASREESVYADQACKRNRIRWACMHGEAVPASLVGV